MALLEFDFVKLNRSEQGIASTFGAETLVIRFDRQVFVDIGPNKSKRLH